MRRETLELSVDRAFVELYCKQKQERAAGESRGVEREGSFLRIEEKNPASLCIDGTYAVGRGRQMPKTEGRPEQVEGWAAGHTVKGSP